MVTLEMSHFSYITLSSVLKFWIHLLHRNSIFFPYKVQHKPFRFFPYFYTSRTHSINTPAVPKGQSENHKQRLHYLPNQTLNCSVSCLSSLSSLLLSKMVHVSHIYVPKSNGLEKRPARWQTSQKPRMCPKTTVVTIFTSTLQNQQNSKE